MSSRHKLAPGNLTLWGPPGQGHEAEKVPSSRPPCTCQVLVLTQTEPLEAQVYRRGHGQAGLGVLGHGVAHTWHQITSWLLLTPSFPPKSQLSGLGDWRAVCVLNALYYCTCITCLLLIREAVGISVSLVSDLGPIQGSYSLKDAFIDGSNSPVGKLVSYMAQST